MVEQVAAVYGRSASPLRSERRSYVGEEDHSRVHVAVWRLVRRCRSKTAIPLIEEEENHRRVGSSPELKKMGYCAAD